MWEPFSSMTSKFPDPVGRFIRRSWNFGKVKFVAIIALHVSSFFSEIRKTSYQLIEFSTFQRKCLHEHDVSVENVVLLRVKSEIAFVLNTKGTGENKLMQRCETDSKLPWTLQWPWCHVPEALLYEDIDSDGLLKPAHWSPLKSFRVKLFPKFFSINWIVGVI